MNRVCQLLGIKYPIFQGAMAQLAVAELAGAVSNAGGLGIIASGGKSVDVIRDEIRKTKSITPNNFAVNIMLMDPHADDMVQLVIDEKVAVVTTGAGTPKKYMPALKAAGVKVVPVVPSAKLAKKMEEIGADAVVAEGNEAGGHVGEICSQVLWPSVVDAVSIPVLAAGGICDGKTLFSAFVLGAEGVQIGTLFSIAKESPVGNHWREAVFNADETSTIITGKILGSPVRAIKNEMTLKFAELEAKGAPREEFEHLGTGALRKAVFNDDMKTGSVMVGQVSGRINKVESCQEIIDRLIREARDIEKNFKLVL